MTPLLSRKCELQPTPDVQQTAPSSQGHCRKWVQMARKGKCIWAPRNPKSRLSLIPVRISRELSVLPAYTPPVMPGDGVSGWETRATCSRHTQALTLTLFSNCLGETGVLCLGPLPQSTRFSCKVNPEVRGTQRRPRRRQDTEGSSPALDPLTREPETPAHLCLPTSSPPPAFSSHPPTESGWDSDGGWAPIQDRGGPQPLNLSQLQAPTAKVELHRRLALGASLPLRGRDRLPGRGDPLHPMTAGALCAQTVGTL